jgi:hypothetical protein
MSLNPKDAKANAGYISGMIGSMEINSPSHQRENWEGWLAFFDGVEDALFEARASLHGSMLEHLASRKETPDE